MRTETLLLLLLATDDASLAWSLARLSHRRRLPKPSSGMRPTDDAALACLWTPGGAGIGDAGGGIGGGGGACAVDAALLARFDALVWQASSICFSSNSFNTISRPIGTRTHDLPPPSFCRH